jgi:hypothetical protein
LQIGYALCAGLILGYITFRYSIKYSIILHAVHSGLIVLVAFVTPLVPGIAVYAMWGAFAVGLIVVAATKHTKVKRFIDRGRARANAWKYTFTVPWLLLYIAITIVLTAVQLDAKPLDAPASKLPPPLIPDIWSDLQ